MIKLLWPTERPRVSQGFNGNFIFEGKWAYRVNGKKDKHRAFDVKNRIGGTYGKKVLCSYDGEVMSTHGNYGIKVRHVINGKFYWTIYWHCLRLLVRKGDKVRMGEHIAAIGGDPNDNIKDGGITTASHTHWRLTEGEKYDRSKSIDVEKRDDIDMLSYDVAFKDVLDYAEESWARGIIGGYAPATTTENIDAMRFQQILVDAKEILQVGPLRADRALVILDKIKGLL